MSWTEHELSKERIAELYALSDEMDNFRLWDYCSLDNRDRLTLFARYAYDLGKESATPVSGSGWTDDELREAIRKERNGSYDILALNPSQLRYILSALGIDHQPKPELPDTPGSVIYDVVDDEGRTYQVMTLGNDGEWCGVDQYGEAVDTVIESEITSFGGVLDLDKVRGEQGA